MKLIEDLGLLQHTKNSSRKFRFGIFECPKCNNHFKTLNYSWYLKKISTCPQCSRKVKYLKQVKTNKVNDDKLYGVWANMKTRCHNPKHLTYKNYGARGIRICDGWLNSFNKFKEWALKNGYNYIDKLELNRIDNDGDYTPDNCNFATRSENSQNTRLLHVNNTSGYRCVFWHKNAKKWMVIIHNNSVIYCKGGFNTAHEAAIAYNKYVIDNNTNHPLNIIDGS